MYCFCHNLMDEIIIKKELFYQCKKCKYLRRAKLITKEEEKARYDKHICDEAYLKYMNNVFLNIKDYIIKKDVLDYGCGQIHALSDILNNNGYCCDYYDLYYYPKLENKTYDTIILIEVFEHIADPYNELQKIKEKLNKNGKIIIVTNLIVNNIEDWWYLRDKTHISFFSIESIKELSILLNFSYEVDIKSNLIILSNI